MTIEEKIKLHEQRKTEYKAINNQLNMVKKNGQTKVPEPIIDRAANLIGNSIEDALNSNGYTVE